MGPRILSRRLLAKGALFGLARKSVATATSPLNKIPQDLQMAEVCLHDAMSDSADAEKRLFHLPKGYRSESDPPWYLAAVAAEAEAVDALEQVYRRISDTETRDGQGLLLKLRLLARAHGISGERSVPGQDADLSERIILSLLRDVPALVTGRAI